jgi:hypothetical protein
MRKEEFGNWLEFSNGRDKAQTSDNVSRADRVERELHVNLDTECQKNRCENVLNQLTVDARAKMPESINLPRDGRGLSSLKTAVRKYVKFYFNER